MSRVVQQNARQITRECSRHQGSEAVLSFLLEQRATASTGARWTVTGKINSGVEAKHQLDLVNENEDNSSKGQKQKGILNSETYPSTAYDTEDVITPMEQCRHT